jgi:hypothetical protein
MLFTKKTDKELAEIAVEALTAAVTATKACEKIAFPQYTPPMFIRDAANTLINQLEALKNFSAQIQADVTTTAPELPKAEPPIHIERTPPLLLKKACRWQENGKWVAAGAFTTQRLPQAAGEAAVKNGFALPFDSPIAQALLAENGVDYYPYQEPALIAELPDVNVPAPPDVRYIKEAPRQPMYGQHDQYVDDQLRTQHEPIPQRKF